MEDNEHGVKTRLYFFLKTTQTTFPLTQHWWAAREYIYQQWRQLDSTIKTINKQGEQKTSYGASAKKSKLSKPQAGIFINNGDN